MPDSSNAFYSARILERRDISDDLWVIRADPGGEFSYLCGHPSMIDNAKGICRRRGWQEPAIKSEVYFQLREDGAGYGD